MQVCMKMQMDQIEQKIWKKATCVSQIVVKNVICNLN